MHPQPRTGPSLRFTTQLERDIYERLQLVGEGPASNFADACQIMYEDEGLRLHSATHLVGHLLREIESAVRAVLLAFARHDHPHETSANKGHQNNDAINKTTGEENHKNEIRVILGHYQIEETSGVGQLWLALAGAAVRVPSYVKPLHAFAHRNALAQPRPLDGSYRLFWDDVLGLLHTLLTRFESTYTTAINIVDELLTHKHPTREDVKRLREAVPNSRVVLGYFFDHCQNPDWISMLVPKSFFDHPPRMDIDEETGAALGFPIWPASRYLARMAHLPTAQRAVEQVVRNIMSTTTLDNVHVREDIVEILSYLPAERIADLALRAAEWLDKEEE